MIKATIRIAQFVIKMLYLNNLDYDIRFLFESFSISLKYHVFFSDNTCQKK